jgi:hypothetical protein
MNEAKELQHRIQRSDLGPNRDFVLNLLSDSSLDGVSKYEREDLAQLVRFVEGRLGMSTFTGHELPGTGELLAALRGLPAHQLVDRFVLKSFHTFCIVHFRSGTPDLLGIMVSNREPEDHRPTSKGSLPPEFLR